MLHTIVRCAASKISINFKYEIKEAIRDGFPGGCLNVSALSVISQYSSSQSVGKSRS